MAVEVRLPDLGEGIEDATISRWLVDEGADVSEGDVILEVATDKVDTEVPAPASGKLLAIRFGEGELVEPRDVLAVIGAEGEEIGPSKDEPSTTVDAHTEIDTDVLDQKGQDDEAQNGQSVKASPVARRVAADKGVSLSGVDGTGPGGRITKNDVLASSDAQPKKRASAGQEGLPDDAADVVSLSVARLAAENSVDLEEIAKGRPLSSLTRYDVMRAVANRIQGGDVEIQDQYLPPAGWQTEAHPAQSTPGARGEKAVSRASKARPVAAESGVMEELVKHSRMRQAIARTTTSSVFTAPHVTTMWDVEMTKVLAHRKSHKAEYAAAGVNLTVTAYLVEAVLAGLRAVPAANSSWTDEGVLVKHYYNIGLAVALPPDKHGMGGLIIPVIKNAGDLNLLGLARAVNDMAERARTNKLTQEDLQGGTFTLTNYGTSGSRFQTPVIMQPQVGILGTGAIEKRPIVVSQGHPLEANTGDYLAFLPMMTLGFSYDHRVLDGASADAFCMAVKDALENRA